MRNHIQAKFDLPTFERYDYCFTCGLITNETDLTLFDGRFSCSPCIAEIKAIGEVMEIAAVNDIADPVFAQPCGCPVWTADNRPDYDGEQRARFMEAR